MHKIEEKDRKKFHAIVTEFHNDGLSYIEATCKVMEMLNLKYVEVVRLLNQSLKEEIKREAISKHLIKGKDEGLSCLFKEG